MVHVHSTGQMSSPKCARVVCRTLIFITSAVVLDGMLSAIVPTHAEEAPIELPIADDDAEASVSGQGKVYTPEEVAWTSLNPVPQLVLHYDGTMNEVYIYSIQRQAEKLRENGYRAVALAGGPQDSVQLFLAGKTSSKLTFSGADIIARKPQNYGAGYYQKHVGRPESHPWAIDGPSPN